MERMSSTMTMRNNAETSSSSPNSRDVYRIPVAGEYVLVRECMLVREYVLVRECMLVIVYLSVLVAQFM